MSKKESPINQLSDTTIDLTKAYVLDGTTLQTTESSLEWEENQASIIGKRFTSRKQFEEIIFENVKVLFGENSFLIVKAATGIEYRGYIPDALLFDFKEQGKPKCYFIETMFAKPEFVTFLYLRMTGFFAEQNNVEKRTSFSELMCKTVNKNYHFKKKLKPFIGEEEVLDFVARMVTNKPSVLLISDFDIVEVPQLKEVYSDTWGKYIHLMHLRKFSIGRETFCSMSPAFTDIDKGKETTKVKVVKSTIDDHFKNSVPGIQESYEMIKSELLKADKTIEFNPKQYYISIRKNKNIAFMHVGKKKISLVVVNPELETRKVIKHHVVKTLTEKVQQFWNGPSCTIIIENTDKLNEVIALLKKLVAKS